VSKVLVDDNYRVKKGDLLVELDKEPYATEVAIKQAAVDIAKANLEVAEASVRSVEAKARSQYWALQNAMEDVRNRIALLQAKVAALDKSKANLKFAQAELDRAKALVTSSFLTREEYDRRDAALSVAQADVTQAREDAHQIRVYLGLSAEPDGGDLGQVPPDLDQTFSSVRQAQSALIQSAAELGVVESYNQTPKQMVEEFAKRSPQGDVDQIFAQLVPGAPAVKQANDTGFANSRGHLVTGCLKPVCG
jgi:membrane fusion protein, multidrug efflux system